MCDDASKLVKTCIVIDDDAVAEGLLVAIQLLVLIMLYCMNISIVKVYHLLIFLQVSLVIDIFHDFAILIPDISPVYLWVVLLAYLYYILVEYFDLLIGVSRQRLF